MRVKNAAYVEKNIELNQEFFFTHPSTKLTMNRIYNSHYSGSPLWNLFGIGAKRIESSYNRSVKIMLDLPYATHRWLIEPLIGHNFRNIMLLVGKSSVDSVKKEDVDKIEYFPLNEADRWKIGAIKEIIDVKSGTLDIADFELEELEEILTYLCTS